MQRMASHLLLLLGVGILASFVFTAAVAGAAAARRRYSTPAARRAYTHIEIVGSYWVIVVDGSSDGGSSGDGDGSGDSVWPYGG